MLNHSKKSEAWKTKSSLNKWIQGEISVFLDFLGKSSLSESLLAFASAKAVWLDLWLSFRLLFESITFQFMKSRGRQILIIRIKLKLMYENLID